MSDQEPYSGKAMERAAQTLEEIDQIDGYPANERVHRLLEMNAHMNFQLMSGLYLELVELRMTIEKASKNAKGT